MVTSQRNFRLKSPTFSIILSPILTISSILLSSTFLSYIFIFLFLLLLASSGKLKEASEPNSEVAAAFSTIKSKPSLPVDEENPILPLCITRNAFPSLSEISIDFNLFTSKFTGTVLLFTLNSSADSTSLQACCNNFSTLFTPHYYFFYPEVRTAKRHRQRTLPCFPASTTCFDHLQIISYPLNIKKGGK